MARRSRFVAALVAAAVVGALVAGPVVAAAGPQVAHPHGTRRPGRMVTVQRGVMTGRSTWVGPRGTMRTAGAATAEIDIDYHGAAWTDAARAAFASAVGYWAQAVTSSVPIVVSATFRSLPGTTLGQAGPAEMRENFPGSPQSDTLYPVALANAIAGSDLNGSDPEIVAEFDNQQPWFFGTDNVVPPDRISFRTVVLHELGHGLGFIGSMDVSGGLGHWGDALSSHAYIFDRFTHRGNGKPMLSYATGTVKLKNALTSDDVYFVGTAVNPRARLYAPTTYSPGSTFNHLDERTYKQGTVNSLMTPFINYGEGIATAGPIVLAAFDDMGWGAVPDVSCRAPGDIDGDGLDDVIGVSSTGDLVLARGIGNGRLSARQTLGTGFGGYQPIVMGEYTGDGCADLLAYQASSHTVWLIPGTGGTDLAPEDQWVAVGSFAGTTVTGMAAIGDFNGDTFADYLVRVDQNGPGGQKGQLWLVPGDGTPLDATPFGSPIKIASGWGSYTELFSAGDVDGDGIGDLFVRARINNGTLKLFRGDGAGGFKTPKGLGTDWNHYSELFASRDLSGDGLVDVVGRNPAGGLELNRTTATGGMQPSVTVLSTGWGTFKVID